MIDLSGIQIEKRGSCVPAAIYCSVKSPNNITVIEGFVSFPSRPSLEEHTWMEIGGQVFDPTLVQFKIENPNCDISKVVRHEAKRHSARKFLYLFVCALGKKGNFWINRMREFGVPIDEIRMEIVDLSMAHLSEQFDSTIFELSHNARLTFDLFTEKQSVN